MEGGTEGRSDGLMEGRETGGREDREERTEGADSRRGGGQRGRRGASGAAGPLRESSRRPRAAADRRREPPRRAAAPFGAAQPPPLPRPPPARPPPPASRAAQRSRADPDGTDRSRQGGTGRGGLKPRPRCHWIPRARGRPMGAYPKIRPGVVRPLGPPLLFLFPHPPPGRVPRGRPRSRDCRQLGAPGAPASLFPSLPAAGQKRDSVSPGELRGGREEKLEVHKQMSRIALERFPGPRPTQRCICPERRAGTADNGEGA